MTFGEQLKRVLEEKGISQRKFAKAMGKDPTYISRIINGNISVSWDMIKLFADTLEISPAAFFVNTEEDMIAILLHELPEDMIEFIKDRPNVPWLYLAKDLQDTDLSPDDIRQLVLLWQKTIQKGKEV
jgi:transcriptional regulator with XRE-family HTH domain